MNGFKKMIIIPFMLLYIFTFSTCYAAETEKPQNDAGYAYYNVIYSFVCQYQSPEWSDWYAKVILDSSYRWGVHPFLAAAFIAKESRFDANAYSPAGAIGPAQLMPDTAAALGVDPYDPYQNIDGGIHYLRQQLDRYQYKGEWATTLAIAAYNAGPGAIEQFNGVPPYSETINHINGVGDYLNTMIDLYNRTYGG